jgi:hypothetical protein
MLRLDWKEIVWYKYYSLPLTKRPNNINSLSLASFSSPSLIFASKAEAYPSGVQLKHWDVLLALPANLRLGWKDSQGKPFRPN